MSDNKNSAEAQVLRWPGKLFSAKDLRRHWQGQRELVLLERALLTPLALDELRAKGVVVTRQETRQSGGVSSADATANRWGYVQEKPDPVVSAAVAALER